MKSSKLCSVILVMLDELPHRVNWKDSNITIGNGLTSLTTGFHETHKERFEDYVGSWTNLEDCRLLDHVSRLGENRWNLIGKRLGKSAFQCSERYLKHLRPQMLGSSKTYTTLIQHSTVPQAILNSDQNSSWTKDEDSTLLQLYLTYGSNWELIANRLTTSGSLHKKRTALDVRQRYEKVVLQYWPTNNQENRPLSSLLFRNSFSNNSLLSTSTPVDLIKNGPLLPSPDKSQFSLPSSSSSLLFIKSNSPKLLESSINDDLTNSPNSSFSFHFYHNNNNDCSSKTTPLKSIHQTTNGSLSVLIADDNHSNNNNNHNNHFVIQTPTKALSEADQLSFHLTSPPAVLGSAGRYPVTNLNHKITDLDKTPIGSRIPRFSQIRGDDGAPLRRPLCTRLFDNIPNDTSLPSTSLSSSFTVSNTNRSNLSEKTSSTLSLSTTSYNSCDEAKCIAILTAKATVWNRALLPTTSTSTTATSSLSTSQKSHLSYFTANNNHNNNRLFKDENEFNMSSYQSHNFPITNDSMMRYHNNLYPYKSYSQIVNNNVNFNPQLKPLEFSSRKQPHLTLRRIVQIANEDDWQEIAYGNNYATQTLIQLAKSFTNNYQQQQQSINELNDLSSHSSLSSPLLPTIKRTISSESMNHYSINNNRDCCFEELEQPMDNYE
ncbi:serine-rich repeat protein, putative [Schistosoma mansoni]|uniref:serine-rich repeat protein, putative n=1 Tax=Schistosoma mansoni TaxID=6183 RepID=UPI00022C8436|nr:serine-rich repeat protein, putative [Schistosoma mansoni]|eukprot:XP_018647267.1 serine-rich repeat protein, putative [Schistosoma mansoni]